MAPVGEILVLEDMGESHVTAPIYTPAPDLAHKLPVLVVEDGSAKGSMNVIVFPERVNQRSLGRKNLDIMNESISRNHATIEKVGDQFFIRDDESRNGTYLNGARLSPDSMIELKHADRIRFADLWTRFVFLDKK